MATDPKSTAELLKSADAKVKKIEWEQLVIMIQQSAIFYGDGKTEAYENMMNTLLDAAGCTSSEKQAYLIDYTKKLENNIKALEATKSPNRP